MRARFTPISPDQRIRELRKEFADLCKEEASPERAPRLAAFTRSAHLDRQLNMAMHTATMCLTDDPDAPAALLAAYLDDTTTADPELHLRALGDLVDLARYVDSPPLREHAESKIHDVAIDWLRGADDHELRHHVRTLGSLLGRAAADALHDEARP